MTSPTSSTSSISGLISGMDTTSVVAQLMQIESQPQTLLKSTLSATKTDAAAYRDVNSAFAALATAAAALTKPATWATTAATSSSSSVTATAGASAQPGSITFAVKQLAAAHSVITAANWTDPTQDFAMGSTLTIKGSDGTTTVGTVKVTSSDTGNASLADAVAAINKSGLGLSAAAVHTDAGYVLQVTSTATGAAKAFSIVSDTKPATAYSVVTKGQDAQITVGDPSSATTGYTATSGTNTFDGVLTGTSFTVSQQGATATVNVASDPDAVANAVQSMVTAANNVLAKIHTYTDSSTGSTAPLKGDWSLISLTGRVLDAVSTAVAVPASGTRVAGDSSAGSNGVQLTRDGTLVFSASDFKTALAADPAKVQAVFSGATGVGSDKVAKTADDTVDVQGVGARLAVLADQASDSATGTLVSLAKGQDTRAKDIQSQIDAWTLRLAARRQTLTAQFTAMETALGTLKNQASWLTSQINQLPSNSKSN